MLYKWEQNKTKRRYVSSVMRVVEKAIFHTPATVASVNTVGKKKKRNLLDIFLLSPKQPSWAGSLQKVNTPGNRNTLLSPPLCHMLGIELLLFSLFDCYLCLSPLLCMCIWTAWFVINQAVMLECLHFITTEILIELIFPFALLCLTIPTVNIRLQSFTCVIIYTPSYRSKFTFLNHLKENSFAVVYANVCMSKKNLWFVPFNNFKSSVIFISSRIWESRTAFKFWHKCVVWTLSGIYCYSLLQFSWQTHYDNFKCAESIW